MPPISIRYFIFISLFIGYGFSSYCQVIKGTVVDQETKETIPFATIYFAGTSLGASADQEGSFVIDISKYASMPLKISAIGYYTSTLTYPNISALNIVYLNPKLYEINEAIIKTRSLARERKRNLRLFRVVFLGSSANAENCVITNEEDISFNYGCDRDTLRAYARKPIQVENRSLGYKVTYYLDVFEYYRHSRDLYFSGEILFNKDLYIEELNSLYLSNRKDAYFGSRMHFFRSLWTDELKRDEYVIKDSNENSVEYDSLVHLLDYNGKYLYYPDKLLIAYHQQRFSEISFLKEHVYFDEFGYFDPAGISWHGDMGRFRIADWLPYDYSVR